MSAQDPIRCAGCDYAGYLMSPDRQVLAWECDRCREIPLKVRPQIRAELREIAARRTAKPPLTEALADLHAIVDGDDIDTGPPDEADALRAQVAALTAERDRLRVLVREQVSCQCSNDDACRFVRERDQARAERDRLARVLACEVGDKGAAPGGWVRDVHHRWARRSPGLYLLVFRWGGVYTWEMWNHPDGTVICHGRKRYARDAMLAADEAARAGEVADKPDT